MAGTQTALRLKSLLKDNFETLYHHGISCSTRMMGGTGYSGVAALSLEQELCNLATLPEENFYSKSPTLL